MSKLFLPQPLFPNPSPARGEGSEVVVSVWVAFLTERERMLVSAFSRKLKIFPLPLRERGWGRGGKKVCNVRDEQLFSRVVVANIILLKIQS
jgi:hypothetical protein